MNQHKTYEKAIVSFTGYLQSPAKQCDFEDWYFRLVSRFNDEDTLTFAPRTWDSPVKDLANQLFRQGVKRVAVLSYSHGQAATVAFAKYAEEIGLLVDLWVSCDGVARARFLPRKKWAQPFSIRSLFKSVSIKVPAHITRTVYIRQEKNWPYGHELIASNGEQTVECAGVYHSVTHQEIDGLIDFWSLVKTELTEWVKPPVAEKI